MTRRAETYRGARRVRWKAVGAEPQAWERFKHGRPVGRGLRRLRRSGAVVGTKVFPQAGPAWLEGPSGPGKHGHQQGYSENG